MWEYPVDPINFLSAVISLLFWKSHLAYFTQTSNWYIQTTLETQYLQMLRTVVIQIFQVFIFPPVNA